MKTYLDEGADPTILIKDNLSYLNPGEVPQWVPAIIYAARHIKPSTIMKHLVDKGASVKRDVITDTTPLIEAAEWGNLSAVEFLLDKGANINDKNSNDVPPIIYAVFNEDIPMIKLMLKERKDEID